MPAAPSQVIGSSGRMVSRMLPAIEGVDLSIKGPVGVVCREAVAVHGLHHPDEIIGVRAASGQQ